MFKRALFAVSFLIAGCAAQSSTESVVTRDGTQIHTARCNMNQSACTQSAEQVCSGSYRVIDSSSNSGGMVDDILPGPVTWYYMVYQCGPSDGKTPTFAKRAVRRDYGALAGALASGTSSSPAPAYRAPLQTNCSRLGNSVNCTTY